ncbi:MAG: M48 family metallopeptidase [Candidatus Omnitrophica bacterium]|nr:M48 family metallopeptidase [Candidatus Omnitrophota bacterium]
MPGGTEKAKEYNKIRLRLKLANLSFIFAFLILFQIFLSGPLAALSFSTAPNFYVSLAAYTVIFSFIHYVLSFPLHFYSGFALEHRFNLSNQNIFDWVKDEIKGGALTLAIFLIFVQALYILLRNSGSIWWVWMAGFWFAVTVILAKITPLVIIPLFFKYSPVDRNLKDKVLGLSAKCGITNVLDVFEINFSKKTNKINAALTGLGKSRRVILADNLIKDFTEEEVSGVLAHEFAHHRLKHIWKSIVFGAASTLTSFYALYLVSRRLVAFFKADSIYDIRILPAFLLIIFLAGFLIMPLQNGFSRRMEKEADRFALKVTQNKNAFVSLMEKLAAKNLSDPNPPTLVKFWFYDHPPVSERINFAKNYKS